MKIWKEELGNVMVKYGNFENKIITQQNCLEYYIGHYDSQGYEHYNTEFKVFRV